MDREPKKLFKYYMDRNIADKQSELQFFRRLNRWRFQSTRLSGVLKVAKLKGPLIFAGIFMIAYDNLFCWDKPQVFGLKFLEGLRDLNDHPQKIQQLKQQLQSEQ